ncbi:hypothetical protein ROA7450_03321 [Roseovarius albus]|uniref:Uncharacterized protein n=1 Tax=Roseovarius albus TaxID=1247867 RepID=A0A1X6ZYC2_9RHOB|nr:hypothetical protein ROA7450_03321 [Roseovarius albus]
MLLIWASIGKQIVYVTQVNGGDLDAGGVVISAFYCEIELCACSVYGRLIRQDVENSYGSMVNRAAHVSRSW